MARDFDGVDDMLSRASTVLTAVPLTMACWFQSDDATIAQTLISIGVDFSGDNRFSLLAQGTVAGDPIRAIARSTVSGAADTSTGYSTGVWHHACGVFASTTSRSAFIDGGSKVTETTSVTPLGLNNTRLAELQSASTRLNGRLADAAIWSVALSDEEVAALARGVSPLRVRPGSLAAYWPLFGVGSPEPDYIGGFHLTLTSAPGVFNHAPTQPPFGFDLGWMGAFTAAAAAAGQPASKRFGGIPGMAFNQGVW